MSIQNLKKLFEDLKKTSISDSNYFEIATKIFVELYELGKKQSSNNSIKDEDRKIISLLINENINKLVEFIYFYRGKFSVFCVTDEISPCVIRSGLQFLLDEFLIAPNIEQELVKKIDLEDLDKNVLIWKEHCGPIPDRPPNVPVNHFWWG